MAPCNEALSGNVAHSPKLFAGCLLGEFFDFRYFSRLRGANILTEMLLKKLNSSGRIHCVPASLRGIYVIRFTITSARTSEEDIHNDWKLIKATADTVLAGSKPRIKLADIKEQAPEFGSSLLLVNTPMTPKVGMRLRMELRRGCYAVIIRTGQTFARSQRTPFWK